MMDDIIYRQDAIDKLDKRFDSVPVELTAEILALRRDLRELPTAQPERSRGKWNFIGDNMFECTCCGVPYTTQQLNGLRNYDTDPYAPKFCPNCGADMRGEQDG